MGNCLTKTKINNDAQSPKGLRVDNGGWRRKISKRLRIGKLSARVDVSPVDETGDTASADDTESVSSERREICSRQTLDSNESEESGSVLILFYARAELVDDDEIGPQGSLLTVRRECSEESSYERFEDTGSDAEHAAEEDTNTENASCSVSIDMYTSSKTAGGVHKQTFKGMTSSDESNADSESVYDEANTVKPACHFFVSNAASGYEDFDKAGGNIDEEIPEEIPSVDYSENDLKITESSNKIGTGNVVLDNSAMEKAMKSVYFLKNALRDPETITKDEKAGETVSAIRSFGNNVQGQEPVNVRRELDYFVSTEVLVSKESKSSTSKGNTCILATDTPPVTAMRRATSSDSRQNVVSKELKSVISLTSVESLEKIKTHKAKSACTFNIFVRSADPDEEPRQIQVRATSQQVKDGAARMFVKSLRNVTDPAAHFDQLGQQNKNSRDKQHLNKNSGLALAKGTPNINCRQRQGAASDVHLTKVPKFYEPPPKKQNAREKLGLENLQKYNIKVQCKEIERIKIDEEQFPGILPPKILEQWKKKRQEKNHIN